jgi:hypothetical protein
MLVDVLLDTPIHVHYGFLRLGNVDPEPDTDELTDATRGQVNGLCGAVVPGVLRTHTGLHTGTVQVRIELHTDEPALDDTWQDAVEVLFSTQADELALTAFDTYAGPVDLPPGTYRTRYCARDMQRGHDLDTSLGDAPVDRYLLQFWPATGIDRIVRQGSEIAGYWHRNVTTPAWTRDELLAQVADMRRRRAEREAEEAGQGRDEVWDGEVPDDPRLRDASWETAQLWRIDPELVEAFADADDPLRRAVAAWAVRRILGHAGLLHQPWAESALTALREGARLDRFQISRTLPPMPVAPGFGDDLAQAQHLAVETMFNASVGNDTLGDVCGAVLNLACLGPHQGNSLADLREAFPALT